MGIERRPISEDEIIKRCVYGMVNEGAKLLEQGIALRPSDIDIIYVTGYGFPAHHGGPMYLADRIGLDKVLADIRRFHARRRFLVEARAAARAAGARRQVLRRPAGGRLTEVARDATLWTSAFRETAAPSSARRRRDSAMPARWRLRRKVAKSSSTGATRTSCERAARRLAAVPRRSVVTPVQADLDHRRRPGVALLAACPDTGHPGQQQRRPAARAAGRLGPRRLDRRAGEQPARRRAAHARH